MKVRWLQCNQDRLFSLPLLPRIVDFQNVPTLAWFCGAFFSGALFHLPTYIHSPLALFSVAAGSLLLALLCVRVSAFDFTVMQLVLCFYVAYLSKVLKMFSLGLHTLATSDRTFFASQSSSGFCKLGLLMVHD